MEEYIERLPLWLTDPSAAEGLAQTACQDVSGVVACGLTLLIEEIDGEPTATWNCDTCNDTDRITDAAEAASAQD